MTPEAPIQTLEKNESDVTEQSIVMMDKKKKKKLKNNKKYKEKSIDQAELINDLEIGKPEEVEMIQKNED